MRALHGGRIRIPRVCDARRRVPVPRDAPERKRFDTKPEGISLGLFFGLLRLVGSLKGGVVEVTYRSGRL